jgi:acetyl esterase/lipase
VTAAVRGDGNVREGDAMDSRKLVDPDLVPLLDLFPGRRFAPETLAGIRAQSDQLRAAALAAAPAVPGVAEERRAVPGPAGAPAVEVLVFRPAAPAGPLPALLWIHGGGHVLGAAEQAGPALRQVVAAAGCVAVAVEYRLSPETPFPGQLDDCYAALAWLHAEAEGLGVDRARIAVGGDSAGGGLAAGLALLARDRGELPLAYQLLLYPMLDDRTGSTVEPGPFAGEWVWTREANRFGWEAFLGRAPGGDGVSPYAAPARTASLAGLPPTFVGVGDLDLFLDEDLAYARRLIHAGVPCELHVYPGAVHGFYNAAGAAVADRAIRDYLRALRLAFRSGPGPAP